jgi:hypothetical protein
MENRLNKIQTEEFISCPYPNVELGYGSSVSVVSDYRLDDWVSIPGR